MELTLKDATAALRSTDEETSDPNGSFEIVLSTAAKDRDGEEVLLEEWEQPLPDHIVMDIDHGMSAATTVGSGTPSLEDGKLVVRGTFASTELGQTMRKLVNEKHIRSTSVAFMRKSKPSEEKDGVPTVTRELLNGAFVAIPANPEAVVMASKARELVDKANDSSSPALSVGDLVVDVKLGARNNSNDAANLQAIHDAASNMGAACGTPPAEDAPAADASDGKALDAETVVLEFIKSMDPQSLPLNVQAALAHLVPETPVVEDQDSKSVSEDSAAAADEAAAAVSDDADALLALNSARIKAAIAAIELSEGNDNV